MERVHNGCLIYQLSHTIYLNQNFLGGNMLSKLNSILLFLLILFALSGCERITDTVLDIPDVSDTQPLTVMTYNVYVGSSAEPLLNVENLLQVPGEVANMYNNVIASNFPDRAVAIANSIKTYHPHLIGLQEISLIRRQSPSNFLTGENTLPEDVEIDFLQILMDALQAEGLNYQVVVKTENIDIEMPMQTEQGLDDIRLTDYDVILARGDVKISQSTSDNYMNALTIDMLGLVIIRGYGAVDATVSGVTYRFVNTHLESETEENRVAQTQELISILEGETLPIILLGDFNTRAPDGTAYQKILAAGYVDLWQMESEGSGNTCCQDDDLLNEITDHTGRIDHIYVRNFGHPISVMTHTVGDKSTDRLSSGLWPSDHAGVVAQISLE